MHASISANQLQSAPTQPAASNHLMWIAHTSLEVYVLHARAAAIDAQRVHAIPARAARGRGWRTAHGLLCADMSINSESKPALGSVEPFRFGL